MLLIFPNLYGIDLEDAGNPIQQLLEPKHQREGNLVPFTDGRTKGFLFRLGDPDEVLILPKAKQAHDAYRRVLVATPDPDRPSNDLSQGEWRKHPSLPVEGARVNHQQMITEVLNSWSGAFSFTEEDPAQNIVGLRRPQIGAVHAAHMYWIVSDSTATIVMPTGTGKTETMLSLLVSMRCQKLLVIVPTDALRTQLVEKFLTLGVLKSPGSAVLKDSARTPIVCTLRHIPATPEELDRIFMRAQVIVTTSHIAGQCDPTLQERMAAHCPYLFIDEAHHAEAPTWSAFKERFRARRILQFTATPFREDGKPLDGDIIFKYPLKLAQQEGYFTSIDFQPVVEFNTKRVDRAIAEKAIEQLRRDRDKGHILMARVENVNRAKAVYEIYSQYPEFNPVQLHTGIKSVRRREAIRQQIISGESRIVVCVDMLGEGFDLP
jgi:superfamily II DNA or RNA helicase